MGTSHRLRRISSCGEVEPSTSLTEILAASGKQDNDQGRPCNELSKVVRTMRTDRCKWIDTETEID